MPNKRGDFAIGFQANRVVVVGGLGEHLPKLLPHFDASRNRWHEAGCYSLMPRESVFVVIPPYGPWVQS